MKIKYIIVILFFFIIYCSSVSNDNYIEICSIDGKQQRLIETDDAIFYQNSTVDTVLLHKLMNDYNFSKMDIPSILKKTDDSSSFVLRIDKGKSDMDSGWFISIFCEFNGRELINFYHYDMGQHPDYWRMKNAYVEIEHKDGRSYLNLFASLKSVTFALSTFIEFPVNEDEVYSDITRYLNVKTRVDITEMEILKYFIENE